MTFAPVFKGTTLETGLTPYKRMAPLSKVMGEFSVDQIKE
jgi:hypothetical protein